MQKNCCVPGYMESGDSHPILHRFPDANTQLDLDHGSWLLEAIYWACITNTFVITVEFIINILKINTAIPRTDLPNLQCQPSKNLSGISTTPRFTFGDQRHLRPVHNIGQHLPSLSKDKYNMFGPEFAVEHHLCQRSSSIDNKENAPDPVKETLYHVETSEHRTYGRQHPPIAVQCVVEKMDTGHPANAPPAVPATSYGKDINRILLGRRKQKDPNDNAQCLAQNYYKNH